MMDLTDRHCRYFFRLLSRRCGLFTEMLHADAVIRGDRQRLLAFDPCESPVALQLGGSDPNTLAHAAKIAADWGYDEINLNVGCPSDRVQAGRFGACLMAEPTRVADCVDAMQQAVTVPVSVKTRLGIDHCDDYEFLTAFVEAVASTGCRRVTIHARKAWLSGLSPKENREIPPLDYDRVYRLKRDFPDLFVIINGGITTLAQIHHHLQFVDGVMLGRVAYQNPYLLAEADAQLAAAAQPPSRHDIAHQLFEYAIQQQAQGVSLHAMSRHWLGLFQGQPGARHWRRTLTELVTQSHPTAADLRQALPRAPSAMSPPFSLITGV